TACWRLGAGSIAPLELLNGAGSADLMIESIRLLRRLIEDHKRFLFIGGRPGDALLRTIGQALGPMEFAIVQSLDRQLDRVMENIGVGPASGDTRWDGEVLSPAGWLTRFREEVAKQVAVGVYRAGQFAPPQIFYTPIDVAHEAAHVALADSMLQPHRGFP